MKASIIGSIIGNILLVLGAPMFVGGLGRERQTFNRTAASAQSAMLLLAMAALVMPAVFQLVVGGGLPAPSAERVDFGSTVEHLSLAVAIVLIARLRAGLIFSLQHAPRPVQPAEDEDTRHGEPWSVAARSIVLAIAGVAGGRDVARCSSARSPRRPRASG